MKRIIEYIKSLFKCRHLVKECINVEIKEDVDGEKIMRTTWICLACGKEFTEYEKTVNGVWERW